MSRPDPHQLTGRTVDQRYNVLEHIAEGGMASVYVALDTRLERKVALKVLHPDLARDDGFVLRFQREARAAARLGHPHVVGVYDQGQDGDLVFLAMELVHGTTLRQLIDDAAPMTVRTAIAIIDELLAALGAAHRAGIVHRDIKPENVLVASDGAIKVADFGLARAVTSETMTSPGTALFGTAAYLSPEQVEHGIADERSDVYSVGLLLFELLTGRKAFPGEVPIQVAFAHVNGDMPAPSELIPTIPAEIDQLIALACDTSPDRRPDNADALAAQVDRSVELLSDEELDTEPQPLASESDRRRSAQDWADDAEDPLLLRHETLHRETQRQETQRHATQPYAPTHTRAIPIPRSANSSDVSSLPARSVGSTAAEIPAAPGRRRRWWILPLTLLLLIALGAGGGYSWWYFNQGPGGSSPVPMVLESPYDDAVAALEFENLRAEPVLEEFSETVAKGSVIRVTPIGGTELRHGSAVTVVVSKGPERFAVPPLAGLTVDKAKTALSRRNLVLGTQRQVWDERVKEGIVITSDPKPDVSLKRDTRVDVVVSKGREPIDVPYVVDTELESAQATITGRELTYRLAGEEFSNDIAAGRVVRQSPSEGSVHRGDVIQLFVSKGPDLVTVPNVIDQKVGVAEQMLTDAGLTVDRNDIFGGHYGLVRFQDPAAGERVLRGSTVKITVL